MVATADTPAITASAQARPTGAAARSAFFSMLARDLTVLRKELGMFIARTIMQPLLLLFVFTYVFQKIGQRIGGDPSEFSTLLIAGVIGSAMIFQGIQAVALPLVQDFGYTKEIEDRVLAPLPIAGVALEKVIAGALQAILAAWVVFPLALFVPAAKVHLHVNIFLLVTILILGAVMSAALGLTIGTRVEPRQVPLIFSLLVIPMTFLGCVYYPWASLEPIKWLKIAVLINPLVYLNEGLRAALTRVPHMNLVAVYLILIAFTAVLLQAGIKGFARRVLS